MMLQVIMITQVWLVGSCFSFLTELRRIVDAERRLVVMVLRVSLVWQQVVLVMEAHHRVSHRRTD